MASLNLSEIEKLDIIQKEHEEERKLFVETGQSPSRAWLKIDLLLKWVTKTEDSIDWSSRYKGLK